MTNDYRQRIYDSYVRSSPDYYAQMTAPQTYAGLRLFYRANYLRWLPSDRRARVIDIGCGLGHFVYFLQKEGFDQAEGIDFNPEMINGCLAQGINHVMLGDWRGHLDSHPQTYEAIVANEFLEHQTKNEAFEFLDAVMMALRPQGRLLLKVPNAYTYFGSRDAYIDFTHEVSYTPPSLVQVLTAAGFTNIDILPVYPPLLSIKSVLRRALWKIVFMPMLLVWSNMKYGGERQPSVYTASLLAVAEKP